MNNQHVRTISGRWVDFLEPDPLDIVLPDIAHSLARLCRFHGACPDFYSVAQHSCLVSLLCPPEMALEGLLHDAAEAYICDVPMPVKAFLPDYNAIENNLCKAIAKRFDLCYTDNWPLIVHDCDMAVLSLEIRTFFGEDWTGFQVEDTGIERGLYESLKVEPWVSGDAQNYFEWRFEQLRRNT